MTSERLVFKNRDGHDLAGRLELPDGGEPPEVFAVFAHCFTCSKDVAAATRVSRALAAEGIAVLRFDFTGLGGSDGDFENTNFSSNVDDLVSAADHLREHHRAPALLIGHSLGGAAVLAAARRIREVEAVATIAAPAEPAHVRKLLQGDIEEIETQGHARVDIGGRPFEIQKQFLDDLESKNLGEELGALRASLLIFHSPTDNVVGVDDARKIYEAARGPRSFINLENADHLLSNPRDAQYVASILTAWASRYLQELPAEAHASSESESPPEGSVRVEEVRPPYTNRVTVGRHSLLADEPERVGGNDAGPDPYGYLLAGLGACTSMTLRMYAARKEWPLEHVAVTLKHSHVHAKDCETCEDEDSRADRIERDIEIRGDQLDDEQRARLLEIADRCPVHRTLMNQKEILTRLV